MSTKTLLLAVLVVFLGVACSPSGLAPANQEHLDILKQGVDEWNKWRDENSEIRPDLSGADFRGANLYEAKVSDEEIADCNILFGATMPDGNRYDGRFNLHGDIELARKEDIDPDNAEAMARWYAGDD